MKYKTGDLIQLKQNSTLGFFKDEWAIVLSEAQENHTTHLVDLHTVYCVRTSEYLTLSNGHFLRMHL